MKRIQTTLIAALAALAFTGCDMSEDYQNCPRTENVSLHFSLLDKKGAEVFAEHIESTELMLFRDGGFHSHRALPTPALGPDREVKLTLDPGEYTVVAWGNVGDRCTMTDPAGLSTAADGTVRYGVTGAGCDPLYYAPSPALGLTRGFNPDKELIRFTVPESGDLSQTIRMTHAHNKLDIYVKGYGKLPLIEVESAGTGFDFHLNPLSGTATLNQATRDKETKEGVMANALFSIARIEESNGVLIHVIDPDTHQRVWTAALTEVIGTFEDFDLEVEICIPILFEFFDGRFTVKMPEWERENMKPGLE